MKALSYLTVLALLVSSTIFTNANAQSDALHSAISSGQFPSGVKQSDVDQFYSQIGYQPIFTSNGIVTAKMAELQQSIQNIERHGMSPADYLAPEITTPPGTSVPNWSTVELVAAQNFINMARNVAVGRVAPSSVGPDIKYDQRTFSVAQLYSLASIGQGNSIDAAIDAVAPQTMEYWNLMGIRSHLMNIRSRGGWATIPEATKTLKVGVSDPVVPKIKRRLIDYGYNITDLSSNVYDANLAAAISDMQAAYQLNQADGQMGPGGPTWKIVNTSLQARIDDVDTNLEKLRWLPQRLEDRHIFVNLAFQRFRLWDKAQSQAEGKDVNAPYMDFRTINGRPDRKTPSMKDKIVRVIFDPDWTVPVKIFKEDKLPMLQTMTPDQLAQWFAEEGFVILGPDLTTQIDPLTINWQTLDPATAQIYMRQLPQYNNALGVVKFEMTNPYSIYFHDTETRQLFQQPNFNNRLLSSGCMRLEFPREFATYMVSGIQQQFLSGSTDPVQIRAEIDNFVVKQGDPPIPKSTPVVLPSNRYLPVYTLYETVELGNDGVMRFAQDFYKQNPSVRLAVRNRPR